MADSKTDNQSTDHMETVSLTTSRLRGALNLVRRNFNVMCNLNLDANTLDELEKMCIIVAKDGISLVVIDKTDDTVIGVCFNKLRVYNPAEKTFYECIKEICKSKMMDYILDIITKVVSKKNPFLFFGVNCILEIVCMLYKPYQAKDISSLLIYGTIELGEKLRDGEERRVPLEIDGNIELTNVDLKLLKPFMVSGVTFTNNNLETFEAFDFKTIATMSYDEVGLNLQLDEENQDIDYMIRWINFPRNTNIQKSIKILLHY